MLIVAGEQIETRHVVGGHQALNLVENREGIEGAEARLLMLRGEPYGVTIGFAGLRAAGLAEIGLHASRPEGNEVLDVRTHGRGEANDQLEIRANTGAVGGFLHQLQIAKSVGDGSGFLVEIGRGENDVGEPGSLRKEHILHDKEGVAERCQG